MVNDVVRPCVKCGARDRYALRKGRKTGDCRPCSSEQGRQWRKANREKVHANSKKYYVANKANMNEQSRRWRIANRGKAAESLRQWKRANPEKVAALKRKWSKENPEKHAAYYHNRRARIKANGGALTEGDIRALYATNPKCQKCGTNDNLSLDHVVPLACGGRNDIDNMQVLCGTCNSSKGTKTIDYRDNDIEYWKQLELIGAGG